MTIESAAPIRPFDRKRYYSAYVISILVLVNALAYLDRQVMLILVEPIQGDLGLSDTQMGIIIGPAFMAFFLAAAMPMGALADRHARNRLLAAGITIWSVATLWAGVRTVSANSRSHGPVSVSAKLASCRRSFRW